MKETLKKALVSAVKAVSIFVAGIATGLVMAEYGENDMYEVCYDYSKDKEVSEDAETPADPADHGDSVVT